jgi:hypothetical protein
MDRQNISKFIITFFCGLQRTHDKGINQLFPISRLHNHPRLKFPIGFTILA